MWFMIGVSVIVAVVTVALIFYFMNEHQRSSEKMMFDNLSRSIKDIQQLFNKTDIGWEYSASCQGNPGKFRQNEPWRCRTRLSLLTSKYSSTTLLTSTYHSLLNNYSHIQSIKKISDTQSSFTLNDLPLVSCNMESYPKTTPFHYIYIECWGTARDFHFPRTDR